MACAEQLQQSCFLQHSFALKSRAVRRPTRVGRCLVKTSAALSFADEHGHHHGRHHHGPPARDLSEGEKQLLVESAAEKIRQQTAERSAKLRNEAERSHFESELKFGKLMFSQANYEAAVAHFDKVIRSSGEQTYHYGEATLQKAACLEKLGREAEARPLYESLIQFRAPFPNIKRRAAQALYGAGSEGKGKASVPYDEYMYNMFVSGFGSYHPKEKYVETEEERVIMRFAPWVILLMAPALLVSLLFFPR